MSLSCWRLDQESLALISLSAVCSDLDETLICFFDPFRVMIHFSGKTKLVQSSKNTIKNIRLLMCFIDSDKVRLRIQMMEHICAQYPL